MTKTIQLLFACMLISSAQAQSDQAIAYQQEHPQAIIMTHAAFNALDEQVQALIQDQVVYLEDLELSGEMNADGTLVPSEELIGSEREFIKQWLGENPEVKIVKRSEYDASSPEVQTIYSQAHVLVLMGENLTREDIANF